LIRGVHRNPSPRVSPGECKMSRFSRRRFLSTSAAVVAAATNAHRILADDPQQDSAPQSPIKLGLVTYNWGKSWDLPTVIKNCAQTGFAGVELRSTHKHGVEITLNAAQRSDVARRFADSPVELVGLGSACEYHAADKRILRKNIEETKAFVVLCHDIGGTGVKVRPNGLPAGVPVEKTLRQIGESLNEVGQFAAGYGVDIRLEVHGNGTSAIPHIKSIMDVAQRDNVVVCWNCNRSDLDGEGLAHNYGLLKDRVGTIHIHDLTGDAYPWKDLFRLLKQHQFGGWTLLEEGRVPDDILAAMKANRQAWLDLVRSA
jgi:sugar phosphate isomerase/epimerase